MVKKTYNVILQSAIGDGTTTSTETFFYDWTQIPDVPYYVSFSFMSATIAMIQFGQIAMLYVDLSQSYNQIATSQSLTQSASNGQFLGNLLYGVVASNNFLVAENNTNPPTFLHGRPRSNNFTVAVRSTPTTDYTTPSGVYCLILSFQEA
jgi:hypothetical protein